MLTMQAQALNTTMPMLKRKRWTFATAFTGNAVYFSIIPFLALFLADVLRLEAGAVGTVLAMRAFASQAFTLPGSLVGRLLGPRPTLALSSLLRAVAYFLLANGHTEIMLIAAVLVIGVASSITTGLSSALVSGRERGLNVLAFANLATFRNAGEIIGFLVGGWLCPRYFEQICLAASLIYLITTASFLLIFKKGDLSLDDRRGKDDLPAGIRVFSRRFVATCLGVAPYSVLVAQLYVVVPLFILSSQNRADFLGLGLSIAALVGVVAQALFSMYGASIYLNKTVTSLSYLLMGFSFVLLPLCSYIGLSDWISSVCCGAVLTFGTVFAYPSAMSHIRACSNGRDTGLYFGIYYTLASVLTAIVTKWLVGVGVHTAKEWVVYGALMLIALLGAVADWLLSSKADVEKIAVPSLPATNALIHASTPVEMERS
ncbi:MFS transporter [Xanthomonas albilineans]|nr:MFS transporter [Xanthomonas albilineans]